MSFLRKQESRTAIKLGYSAKIVTHYFSPNVDYFTRCLLALLQCNHWLLSAATKKQYL